MLKLLAALILVAAALVVAVTFTMPDGSPAMQAPAAAARLSGPWAPSPPSFAAGLLCGLVVAWVWSLPWGYLPVILAEWLGRWTRRAQLVGLGILFACIILYF